jgi:hypothetical protein
MPFFVNDTRSSATSIIHEIPDSATNIIDRILPPRKIANSDLISSLEFNFSLESAVVRAKTRTWHIPCYQIG